MSGRGVVGDKWSQRILWLCAIGSAVSLYFVAVERQAQNRHRMMQEGLPGLDTVDQSAGANQPPEEPVGRLVTEFSRTTHQSSGSCALD